MAKESTTSVTQELGVTSVTAQDSISQAAVQVDDDRDDDLGYYDGDSEASASFLSSLNSSILQYKYANGRRYHAFREGAYLVPNDDEEQERMDLGHHIYRLLLNGELLLAPIGNNPQRVLDLGTGTGIWAMDFADQYPSATVLGTDLSPIQPQWTPPNCTFEVDDFDDEWTYRKKFDYIHARELEGCVGNPDQLFRRAFEHLAPGGWFEIQAVCSSFGSDDGSGDGAKTAQKWMETICDGARKFGKPLDSAPEWQEKIKAAGFVDVQQEIRKAPIGQWPKDPALKEIGKFQYIQEQQAIESYTPGIFANVLGWKDEEIKVTIAKVKKEIKNPNYHLYLPVYFIWGRKP